MRIKGLLPNDEEYREILEIVKVKKHSFLQIQNKSLNFPVRYRNRTISIGFAITELDNSAEARKWFDKGKEVMGALRATSWLAGSFGTGLFYELASEVADRVFQYANANDHVFSMKQVDFLPALSVTGLQEQLLLTEGRYIVVAVPPATAYESLRALMDSFPERIDGGFLKERTFYEGGYLKLNQSGSEYTFTPYIVLNVVMGKRYFDENPIIEDVKEANRLMQFGKLEEADAMLRAAEAKFTMPTAVSPREVLREAGVVPEDRKKGLLDLSSSDLIQGAVSVVRGQDPKRVLQSKLKDLGALGGLGSMLGLKPDKPAAPAPAAMPTASALGVKVERLYTDLEYTFFADLLSAMNAKGVLLAKSSSDRNEIVKVLRLFRRSIDNSRDLPRSPAECQVYKTSMTDLRDKLTESYGLSPDDEVSDGNKLSLLEKLTKKTKQLGEETPEEAFDNLLKQQEFVARTLKDCLPAGLKAY
ncbi:MAG: hypothetical protein FJ125_11180 [Deltaproteobacteria bacterium]|nr:hypothetical protein [Deltaproteobacteria bacterium]